MKKLLLGTLAMLIPLGWAGPAHALGVFGLCVNKRKDACCYPQQNAFTPACCGVTVVTQASVVGPTMDGAGHFGMFGHGKFCPDKGQKFKSIWGHWGHKGGPGCAECGGGFAGEYMGYGGYAMGDGYAMGEDGYAMGEDGSILGDGSYAMGQNSSPMGEDSFPLVRICLAWAPAKRWSATSPSMARLSHRTVSVA